jgi:hypothetical protein
MSGDKVYEVSKEIASHAWINAEQYDEMYRRSIEDSDAFWGEQAEQFVTWTRKWDSVSDWSFDAEDVYVKWFDGGKLNVAYNCLDRHLETRGDQVAIIWEGDDPSVDKKITYRELHEQVSRFGNALKARGVKKGDRVCIYMPMIPEAAVAMLACARIGAVHSVVFGGFSPESLKDRILDSDCRVVITADEGLRGSKHVPCSWSSTPAATCSGTRIGTSGTGRQWQRPRRIARPRRWMPRTRCSFCTHRDRPASPRGCCTPPAAIWCLPRPLTSTRLTTTKVRSTGVPPTSGGSPATPISCTARWPMAPSP